MTPDTVNQVPGGGSVSDTKSEAKHSPGPWHRYGRDGNSIWSDCAGRAIAKIYGPRKSYSAESEANARLVVASPDLLEAAKLQEVAEEAWANCNECGGEGVPELCAKCFPLFDDARLKRRAAIAKAEGRG